ncbi:hypothetical protein [Winogradskyella flava]|uniref:Uncharacterized protein n=1 Tax=Winogradskyella flava TaxID=1884876 RepID=A0A842IQ72_9FLAO|nr:hypothetical protein [Winogradskyella flava]MBC2844951.1 hypothetical protein [Winogradskyella flava]
MKKHLYILLFLTSIISYGQVKVDTIKFQTIKFKTVDSIESLGLKIIDTLTKPKAFILTNHGNAEVIAIKKGCKFLVFDLLPEGFSGSVTTTKQIQINGKNYKELVVYWSDINGHSGLGGGFSETFKGILIYDLKKIFLIFNEEYYFSHYQWMNDISENLEVISTSEERECDNLDIKFGHREITMEMKISKDCDSINFLEYDATTWSYKLKSNFLIRTRIKTIDVDTSNN